MPPRAALITGASSGIGFALARQLALDGYSVTLCARGAERLDDAVASLRGQGADAHAAPVDVADPEALRAAISDHRARFGRLDALVHSAAHGGPVGPLEQLEVRRLDRLLAVNLEAPAVALAAAEPMLREAGAEHAKALVVWVASVAAVAPQPWIAAYSAAKAGLLGLARESHGRLAPAGIQVTAFCPALVDTPMSAWVEDVPREEMMSPQDLAEALRFLLRTSASCFVPELVMVRPTATV